MVFRKKFSNGIRITGDRLKKTRLYILENGKWTVGNASAFIELLSTGVRTGASSVSARNAAIDLAHAVEDFTCADYKCLALDTVATACDLTGMVVSFIPGVATKKVFGLTASTAYFCRTFRNECKKTNLLGCK